MLANVEKYDVLISQWALLEVSGNKKALWIKLCADDLTAKILTSLFQELHRNLRYGYFYSKKRFNAKCYRYNSVYGRGCYCERLQGVSDCSCGSGCYCETAENSGQHECCDCRCFPSTAKVNLQNGKTLTMSELQIGDKVQTGRK